MIIKEALQFGVATLTSTSDSAHLDSELLLCNILKCSRAFLIANADQELSAEQLTAFKNLLKQRQKKIPLAYLLGEKEFWSLNLLVTSDVLVPRPETELFIEIIDQLYARQNNIKVADLGTGSGAIALALAKEHPDWQIVATDISAASLDVAKKNAAQLSLQNVEFALGVWCDALPKEKFSLIVSNPPYLAENDPHLSNSEISHEPHHALVAKENGLADLCTIIASAKNYLVKDGYLLVEHGFEQAPTVQEIFQHHAYQNIHTWQDLAGHDRITGGRVDY